MTPLSIVSTICLLGGFTSFLLGIFSTRDQVRRFRRIAARQHVLVSAMPDELGRWFFEGFANMTVTVYALRTVGVLLFWVILGLGLAGLGFSTAV